MTSHFIGWSLAEAAERAIGSNNPHREEDARFWTMVESGQLVVFGRRQPQSDREQIPAAICRSLIYRDYRRSSSSGPDGNEKPFIDILVYPILHSPNVIEFLDRMSLKDAFWQFVLGDPEVKLLAAKAIKADSTLESVYLRGRHSLLAREWPLKFDQGDLAGGRSPNSPVGFLSDPPPDEVQRAADIVCFRYGGLLTLLRQGHVEAVGDPVRSRGSSDILPAIWSHRSYYMDAQNGDVLQVSSGHIEDWLHFLTPRWRAVMLKKPQAHLHSISGTTAHRSAGQWTALGKLTTGEQAVFSAIKGLFPNGLVKTISASARNVRIRDYQRGSADFSEYSDQTIKRCLQKIQFRPRMDRPDPT
jgi:hypothetical protein